MPKSAAERQRDYMFYNRAAKRRKKAYMREYMREYRRSRRNKSELNK